jgi:hypothetical protein
MGRETGSLHLLAPLLLTGVKGADLVIRGNVVLNSLHVINKANSLSAATCFEIDFNFFILFCLRILQP